MIDRHIIKIMRFTHRVGHSKEQVESLSLERLVWVLQTVHHHKLVLQRVLLIHL